MSPSVLPHIQTQNLLRDQFASIWIRWQWKEHELFSKIVIHSQSRNRFSRGQKSKKLFPGQTESARSGENTSSNEFRFWLFKSSRGDSESILVWCKKPRYWDGSDPIDKKLFCTRKKKIRKLVRNFNTHLFIENLMSPLICHHNFFQNEVHRAYSEGFLFPHEKQKKIAFTRFWYIFFLYRKKF